MLNDGPSSCALRSFTTRNQLKRQVSYVQDKKQRGREVHHANIISIQQNLGQLGVVP
jgi:hypothetical protein